MVLRQAYYFWNFCSKSDSFMDFMLLTHFESSSNSGHYNSSTRVCVDRISKFNFDFQI